jgi:hypothetical protein
MATDNDDDLFNEEFDLVDDNEYDVEDDHDEGENITNNAEEIDAKAEASAESDVAASKSSRSHKRKNSNDEPVVEPESDSEQQDLAEGDNLDEYGRPKPETNYVVHIYEYQKFKRTLDRPFTPEDAEAFATEYNRTGKQYSRFALAGKSDVKPKKAPQL